MRLAVISHKPCWPSGNSPSGFATDGGFPMQMAALSELFDATQLLVPVDAASGGRGELPLVGRALSVEPLRPPRGIGMMRKLRFPAWLLSEGPRIARAVRAADAVHAPIPGDVGTIGMLLALVFRRRLFVRYCGNWRVPRTAAQRLWLSLLERIAVGSTVVLATGGDGLPPSQSNPAIEWIFSTSLTRAEIEQLGQPRTLRHGRPRRLVIACRQDDRKGTGIVLQALDALRDRFPDLEFHVAGDGPDLPAFRSLADTLGLTDRVTFHGKLDHEGVIQLLRKCDLFCFPTRASEGFPKAVLEAMACGLPVVTTPVSVLPQLVGRGGGIVVSAADPSMVAQGIATALGSEGVYAAMSRAAVDAAREFSIEAWSAAIQRRLVEAWGAWRGEG